MSSSIFFTFPIIIPSLKLFVKLVVITFNSSLYLISVVSSLTTNSFLYLLYDEIIPYDIVSPSEIATVIFLSLFILVLIIYFVYCFNEAVERAMVVILITQVPVLFLQICFSDFKPQGLFFQPVHAIL